ncbi:hypothetical protein Pedsa_0301 [Pseudopedobacter saltans DSM 12145]|uniref:DUF3826 domain-containing protein n=1 Tax=Pseudopedobacter saltans (strain ATCC 51119 / DSM 12145 / JCM 21818 / CCUG 39354 / LMG 10337 / NBRC 100064 / NCIMB 13643) TaxID=762903 RepID=F0S4C8_PSESL|nr:DUF3826 domain-containing protein [Pseudopedobacter saltans]ADY50885.1 hypothetical protein Pedsa_0301 [Pseudopedobacter saltans DSM 12145]
MSLLIKRILSVIVLIFSLQVASAQKTKDQQNEDYTKVITQRAGKIIDDLNITDSAKYYKVRTIVVQQYRDLNTHHEVKAQNIKLIKEKYSSQKELRDSKVKEYEDKENKKLRKIHKHYIAKLSRQVNDGQLEKVKNGMTYGVLPITIKAYNEMLPQLTEEQKATILKYLTEARELAMDEPGSKEKHHMFGKYKGKINNYLSGQGIDMNKAGKEWQERIRANAGKK